MKNNLFIDFAGLPLPIEKENLDGIVSYVIKKIMHGEICPVKADAQLKCLEDIIKAVRKNVEIKSLVISEIEDKYQGENVLGFYPKIIRKRTFSFGDDLFIALRKNEIKEREEFRKAIKEPMIFESTGELVDPAECKESFYQKYDTKK